MVVGNMGKKRFLILAFFVIAVVLVAGCIYPADDTGVTRQLDDTGAFCTLNDVSSASVSGISYYVVNVTLWSNASGRTTYTSQDFTLSDVPTNSQDVEVVLGAGIAPADYDLYFQKDPLNLGHAYVFGFHDPSDVHRSASFNLTLS